MITVCDGQWRTYYHHHCPKTHGFYTGTRVAHSRYLTERAVVKQNVPSPRRLAIAYEILAYFADHPEAKDTIEGIVEWWLLEQRLKRAKSQVKTALTQLVAEGLLIARESSTGRVYYRINRQKMREIRTLLRENPHDER